MLVGQCAFKEHLYAQFAGLGKAMASRARPACAEKRPDGRAGLSSPPAPHHVVIRKGQSRRSKRRRAA
jgi:hypothetical protein